MDKNDLSSTNIRYPRAIVGGLVYNSKNEILLIKSNGKYKNQWIVPGGKVDWGETMAHGFAREIREETNIELRDIHFLGVEQLIEPERHFIFLQHSGVAINENDVKINYEAIDFGWFTRKSGKNSLDTIDVATPTMILIQQHYK